MTCFSEGWSLCIAFLCTVLKAALEEVPLWTLLVSTESENFRGIDYHILKKVNETRIGEIFFCNTVIV